MFFNNKILSINQPYFFPYIGYFHLIESANKIVFYDDVNYIKGGWINRNRILINGSDYLFTIPVKKGSQNKLINEITPIIDKKFKCKFLTTIKTAYHKAPYYNQVNDLIQDVIHQEYDSISDMAINSITSVYDYLGKEIKWTKSSICSPFTKGMDKADRLIKITKDLGYHKYVNLIYGQKLYSKDYFLNSGVELYFIKSDIVSYRQFDNEFIPSLSIIDVLMFNDKRSIKNQFAAYSLTQNYLLGEKSTPSNRLKG